MDLDEVVDEPFEDDELAGGLTRGDVLRRGVAAGAAAWGVSALFGSETAFAALEARPLTPTFYQWIYNNHPVIPKEVNPSYAKGHRLDAKIAPVAGFGIERFVAEAKKKKSTWDVYVGQTPFVEMAALIDAGVTEPWDKYMPKSVVNDLIPSIRKEATYQGHIWNWPFLLDVIIQAWNAEIVEKADLDPTKAPKTWDGFIANARQVVSKKAAPFGAVFDAHGWRSLAPITHTFSTNVYTPAGLFDFTHPATVNALEVMKRMMEVAPKNILEPGTTDAGVNVTPDEQAFAARQAAYYVKYQNAPTRFAGTWPDPSKLKIAGLPKQPKGKGATVFWNTGATLFKYGENKRQAADYMRYLTYDQRIWRQSQGKDVRGAPGQLAPYQSLWRKWKASPPSWMAEWAYVVLGQLQVSQAIRTHKFGLQQFVIGQPGWETYLKGETNDPRKALRKARDLVQAEIKKQKRG
jgi:ABC-type glycerol-3-phosphate transport system substrate-binding protein